MDPELAQQNVARDKPLALKVVAAFALELTEHEDGLVWLLSKTVSKSDIGPIRFMARLDLSQYDIEPPSLTFCNPENPRECGQVWWVKSSHPHQNVINSNGTIGNCIKCFREYFVFHPTDSRNPRDWKLSIAVRNIGQLLDPRYVIGRGV